MNWENLTALDFKKAAEETGVCILPLGVIEKHSEHLPLGTDFINAHKIATRAAEKEPAVVFPPFYFGQIYEARCFPGTIAINPGLLMKLLQEVFIEINRNNLKKILIFNGHGGNNNLVRLLAQFNLARETDYSVYVPTARLTQERKEEWNNILDVTWGGHAHESETSITMQNYPDLVEMDRVPEKPARPLDRLDHLEDIFTGISWYADYPDHYSGDARKANAEKGEKLVELLVDTLAEQIAMVKQDEVVPGLLKEFFSKGD